MLESPPAPWRRVSSGRVVNQLRSSQRGAVFKCRHGRMTRLEGAEVGGSHRWLV